MGLKEEGETVSLEEEVQRLQEGLKQLAFQNKMMLGWVNGAVIRVDNDGNIIEANEVALRDVGWQKEDLVGHNMHEVMHHSQEDGSEYPWEFCPTFAAIEDGSSHHVDGDVFWHLDGSSFKVDYIVSPTRNEKNEITGAIVIFRNLTAQKLIEAQRIHGMKLESIGQLSAGIAHEINTPMQFIGNNIIFLRECFEDLLKIIEGYGRLKSRLHSQELEQEAVAEVDALLEEADFAYLADEIPAALDQTLEGVDRVTTLISGLKGFAHSGSDENKKDVDLNEIIQNAVIICQNAYKYVADLETDYGDIPEVKVYAEDIGQVLVNLIVNASHAIEDKFSGTEGHGVIHISTYVEDGYVVVSVADNGGGIPEKLRARVFDPFFTTKDVGRGSGQGLAISRNIIHDKHDGELTFSSEVGIGTEFFIRLKVDG